MPTIGRNSGIFRDRQRIPTSIVGASRPRESQVFPGNKFHQPVESEVNRRPLAHKFLLCARSHVQARAPSSSHTLHPTERFRHRKDGEYRTGQFPSCESPHRFYCRTSIRHFLLRINMTQEILLSCPGLDTCSVAGRHLLFRML